MIDYVLLFLETLSKFVKCFVVLDSFSVELSLVLDGQLLFLLGMILLPFVESLVHVCLDKLTTFVDKVEPVPILLLSMDEGLPSIEHLWLHIVWLVEVLQTTD